MTKKANRVVAVGWAVCLLAVPASFWTTCAAAAEEAVFAEQGKPRAVREIGGVKIDLASPPEGIALRRNLRILAATAIQGKVIHRSSHVWVPRATITPKGDYLLLFPEGKGRHYQGERMLAYRSSDKGKTWSGPTVAFDSSQSHHGFVPLAPRGSKRIYAFGTQAIPGMIGKGGLRENAPIGFRYSDDDGHTWSDVTLIRPENDPEFTGMSCVRMCETDAGTWLIGSHDGIWGGSKKAPVLTRQYVLRSEDKGKTWQLLPKKRPGGWQLEKYDRMDEGTLLNLGGGKVLLALRTAEGHIWESRSRDDGRTWSAPKPTTLVHPDAPPMVFQLGDGKTLIAFVHNRYDPDRPHFDKAARNELWCSISKDQGQTWSEPRFVFAGAAPGGHIHSCSYVDMFADGSRLHVVLGQDGRQLLYLHFDESDLPGFLTKAELKSTDFQVPAAWEYSAPLITPEKRKRDPSRAQKDPTIVFYGGRWHVFMTVKLPGRSAIEYCSFARWEEADKSRRTILKISRSDYYCAPQVFYFSPHKKWYLVYQMGVPGARFMWVAYSTTTTIADPDSWTAARPILDGGPTDPRKVGGLDYWIICDDQRAYLFLTSLNGKMWRLWTKLENFPKGFDHCELALRAKIFEASHTYRLKGMDKYLTIVEENGRRYYKAYLADRLDGRWTPVADTAARPFAGWKNVRPARGVEPWTDNVSHGELVRDGFDQTLTVDPGNLRLVFQGMLDKDKSGKGYGQFQWRIGILTPQH